MAAKPSRIQGVRESETMPISKGPLEFGIQATCRTNTALNKRSISMDKHFAIALLGAMSLSLCQTEASASTLSGPVITVRANEGSGGASGARVSIQMAGTTDCPTSGWYAFENADSGVRKIWTDLATTALQTGRQLTITGSGTCDQFNVEGVTDMDLNAGTGPANPPAQ
jgi:hypothetical protein